MPMTGSAARRRRLATPPVAGLLVLLVAGLSVLGGSLPAAAGEPALAVDRPEARPGDRVVVRLAGWAPGNVVIEVCGNGAAGGSADCAVDTSVNAPVDAAGVGQAAVRITVPPAPCPCVLRARALTGGAVRTAALRIRGVRTVQTRPRPAAQQPALAVQGLRLRGGPGVAALLSGPAHRELTVTVRNTGPVPVSQPRLAVTVGRPGRPTTVVICPPVGQLAPGQQQTLAVPVTFGAPTWGSYAARVELTGATRPVVGHAHTYSYPWGLLLVPFAAAALLLFRLRRRRRTAPDAPSAGAPPHPYPG